MTSSEIRRRRAREDKRSACLALNCFQFSSCWRFWRAPREPSVPPFPRGVADQYPNATWMGDLVEREVESGRSNKATLKHMVLPGSHDSASYSIPENAVFSAIGRTQNLTIREQLLTGIRFFDLRIASRKGGEGVNIYHGFLMGGPFEEVLNDIRLFCRQYPTEFVVLLVAAEHGRPFSPEDKLLALNMMRSHLGSINDGVKNRLLCKVSSRNDLVNTPIQKLVKNRGRVLVLLACRIFDDFVANGICYDEKFVQERYGFIDSERWLRNKWHNTVETLTLLESNLREIRAHKTGTRRYLVNNQFVLTPAFNGDVFGLLSGRCSLQPVQLCNHQLYQPPGFSHGKGVPAMHEIFVEHPEEDWNVVSLDFVDLAPSVVDLCVGFNFHPLEIQLALLGNGGGRRSAEDVTELVRAKVLRQTCLFLHPLHEFDPNDFAVPGFSMTIVYKISGTMYSIVIPLSKEDAKTTPVIVLHEHNHLLAGGAEISFGEEMQGNGKMSPRNSGVTVTWQKTEQMSFRFAYLEDDDDDAEDGALAPQ